MQHRSEKDAALCACVVALSPVTDPRVEQFLRWLRGSRLLTLAWASELADYLVAFTAGSTRHNWQPIGYLFLVKAHRAVLTGGSGDSYETLIHRKVSDAQNSLTQRSI